MIANKEEIALMAHLMRRAGFGASREELEARVEKGYEATVEELLHPEEQEPVDEYDLLRYHIYLYKPRTGNPPVGGPGVANWMYFLINTKSPPPREDCPFLASDIRHRSRKGQQLR